MANPIQASFPVRRGWVDVLAQVSGLAADDTVIISNHSARGMELEIYTGDNQPDDSASYERVQGRDRVSLKNGPVFKIRAVSHYGAVQVAVHKSA